MRKTLAAAAAVIAAAGLAACGSSTPSNAGGSIGSAVAIPPTPTPTPTPVRPTPSGRDYQSYMDCLADPATTLQSCQQFNPSPSPSVSPTPTGHLVHMTGEEDVYNTGGDCVSTGQHADVGPQSVMRLEDSNGTLLASAPLGAGVVNKAAKACVYTFDFGQVPEQANGYITTLAGGLHGQLTWTKTEVEGLGFKFGVHLGSA